MSVKTSSASRFSLVAAVLVAAMIGNWRVVASAPETPRVQADRPIQLEEMAGHGVQRSYAVKTGAAPVDADEAQLVPAIYAWDPRVRLVYYRHYSQWM